MSMSIVWSGSLISGNPVIDFQHKLALEMIKKLRVDYETGGNKYTLDEAITFFSCYMVEHFGDEEDIISRHKLPGLKQHSLEHKEIAKAFEAFKNKAARNGFSRYMIAELLGELCQFLITHLKTSDSAVIIKLKKIYIPEKTDCHY